MEAPAKLISFIALLPLHLLLSCSPASATTSASRRSRPTRRAAPATQTATRLSLARASAAVSAIANLSRSESNPSLRGCLGVCSEVYGASVDHLGRAMRSLGSRQYREAVAFLSAAADEPDNCEDAFVEAGGGAAPPPVLVRADGVYGRVAAMALIIAANPR